MMRGRIDSVDVLVVSWNGRRHLETLLPALEAQQDPGAAVKVRLFDNGSTDGTVAWVRSEYPRVEVLANPVNLGFSAANNRLAESSSADSLALVNNDTRPRPDWLAELVGALRSAPPDVTALSGCIVDWEGGRLDFGRGVMTFDGHALQLDYHRPLAEAETPVEGSELLFPCGGNMIVRRDAYLAAGGFDESYFAYLEDVDLGWRLWAAGERVLSAPQAVVHHRSMATSNLLGNANRGLLFERNAYLTAFKNYDAELWPQPDAGRADDADRPRLSTCSPTATPTVRSWPSTRTAPFRWTGAAELPPGMPLVGPERRWRREEVADRRRRAARCLGAGYGPSSHSAPGSGGSRDRTPDSPMAYPPLSTSRLWLRCRAVSSIVRGLDGAAERRRRHPGQAPAAGR